MDPKFGRFPQENEKRLPEELEALVATDCGLWNSSCLIPTLVYARTYTCSGFIFMEVCCWFSIIILIMSLVSISHKKSGNGEASSMSVSIGLFSHSSGKQTETDVSTEGSTLIGGSISISESGGSQSGSFAIGFNAKSSASASSK